jgi:hypothetical protein
MISTPFLPLAAIEQSASASYLLAALFDFGPALKTK